MALGGWGVAKELSGSIWTGLTWDSPFSLALPSNWAREEASVIIVSKSTSVSSFLRKSNLIKLKSSFWVVMPKTFEELFKTFEWIEALLLNLLIWVFICSVWLWFFSEFTCGDSFWSENLSKSKALLIHSKAFDSDFGWKGAGAESCSSFSKGAGICDSDWLSDWIRKSDFFDEWLIFGWKMDVFL